MKFSVKIDDRYFTACWARLAVITPWQAVSRPSGRLLSA
jgi:hypothetical protein